MKIDLHCHTLKCKKGDSENRTVSKDFFINQVRNANVEIVAITNHNTFSYEQYISFKNQDFMLWPGIELDVVGENSKGHCILICNPQEAELFNSFVCELNILDVDTFSIDINQLSPKIQELDIIIMCHYGKKPELSKEDMELFKEKNLGKPFFCEPQNLMSAGIYFAHNINSMLGSDVKDWKYYHNYSFPELKLRVDSFEKFKLLLSKDMEAIKTFVDKKYMEKLTLIPFENQDDILTLPIYSDVNVIFGGKGTGKSKILASIDEYYKGKYTNEVAYYCANNNSIDFNNLIKNKLLDDDFDRFEISNCSEQFQYIKNWTVTSIEPTKSYYNWVLNKNSNRNFGFINTIYSPILSDLEYKKELENFNNLKDSYMKLKKVPINSYLGDVDSSDLKELLNKLFISLRNKVIDEYAKFTAKKLVNFTIEKMKQLYMIKKGAYSKPTSIGLIGLYNSSKKLNNEIVTILDKLKTKPIYENTLIGNLPQKGIVYLRRIININPYLYSSSHLFKLGNRKMTILKNIHNQLERIHANSFDLKVIELVSQFNESIVNEGISDLKEFLSVSTKTIKTDKHIDRFDLLEYEDYSPSNGEKSMLLLNHSLLVNKKVYILDEPEMSVGHDYINKFIVPRLNELSKQNKIIIPKKGIFY